MIHQIAVVPTTPLLLDGLAGTRHHDIEAMAVAAGEALEDVHSADLVILLACGDHLSVTGMPSTDLSGYGMGDLDPHPLTAPDPAVVSALAATPMGVGDDGGGDLRVMARLVPPGTVTVGVSVPPDLASDAAVAVAETIVDLADDRTVVVIAAGDLGAGHGRKPPRPTAAEASVTFDASVVAALDGGPVTDLLEIPSDLAAASASRGVGSLRILGALAQQVGLSTAVRASGAPLGVGYVVATGS